MSKLQHWHPICVGQYDFFQAFFDVLTPLNKAELTCCALIWIWCTGMVKVLYEPQERTLYNKWHSILFTPLWFLCCTTAIKLFWKKKLTPNASCLTKYILLHCRVWNKHFCHYFPHCHTMILALLIVSYLKFTHLNLTRSAKKVLWISTKSVI